VEIGAILGVEIGAILGVEIGATLGVEIGATLGVEIGATLGVEKQDLFFSKKNRFVGVVNHLNVKNVMIINNI